MWRYWGIAVLGLALLVAVETPSRSAAVQIPSPVTIEKVLGFLNDNPQVRTIDGLLSALPEDFRSNYTLMYGSNSLQGAKPERPRAIVYGTDGRFVIAFNGGAPESRSQTLETIQFRDDQARFEFRELEFPESNTGKVQVSAVNPPLCLSCHYQDPRPNWEHYSTWPGAYGSSDDRLAPDPAAQTSLLAFVEQADKLDRYRHLLKLREGYKESFGGRTQIEHNTTLLHRMSQLNFKRIARSFRDLPAYPQFKYLMAATPWCNDFEKFFPEHPSSALQAVQRAVLSVGNETYAGKSLAALGQALGLDARSFYLDFITPPAELSMITPLNPPQMMTVPMLVDDELKTYFRLQPSDLYGEAGFRANPIGDICPQLAEKSRAALQDWGK